jgi:AcrR family transcriptional regulator
MARQAKQKRDETEARQWEDNVKIDLRAGTSLMDDARHRRILRCATEAFLVYGYVGTSVENIAIDASVSKLTIYRLFVDKAGLATAVLEGLCESLERELRTAIDMDASPEDCLVKVGVAFHRWMNRSVGKGHHYAILRLLIDVSPSHPEVVKAWVESCNKVIYYPITEYIGKCIERGEISGEDPYFIASRFFSDAFHSAQAMLSDNSYNREEMMTRKVRMFLRGCGGPAYKSADGGA